MTYYEELLIEADNNGLITKEKDLKANKGRIKGHKIAIKRDIPTLTEKSCVLAEELGHYYTTSGDILSQETILDQKQEQRARAWAYARLLTLESIIDCCQYGCQSSYEIAEHLGVTEQFLADAVEYYRRRYGLSTKIGNYVIYFEPLTIRMT